MQPFIISEDGKRLKDIYPCPEELRTAAKRVTDSEKFGIVQQWLSEGIPCCFRECPLLYEAIRGWLGRAIKIHTKEITLIGSARIGYSLAPSDDYGRPFNNRSDLDFSAISSVLFEKCVAAFELWLDDYQNEKISPRNPREEYFWKDNAGIVPINIRQGFIDPYKIPTRPEYQTACDILDSLSRLHMKLKITGYAPRVRKVTIRVYRDWWAAIKQLEINFSMIAESN